MTVSTRRQFLVGGLATLAAAPALAAPKTLTNIFAPVTLEHILTGETLSFDPLDKADKYLLNHILRSIDANDSRNDRVMEMSDDLIDRVGVLVQQVRHQGYDLKTLFIHEGYRTPKRQAELLAKNLANENSFHVTGEAVDISAGDVITLKNLFKIACKVANFENRGGVGLSLKQREIVHVDVGPIACWGDGIPEIARGSGPLPY